MSMISLSDPTPPIVRFDRWFWRHSANVLGSCRLETFTTIDKKGNSIYNVLVTERGDNPGPSVTNDHARIRSEVEKWLDLPVGFDYRWLEQYDEHSYIPSRTDLSEVCGVLISANGTAHWYHIPDDEWREIYSDPRREKPKTIRRKSAKEG